MSNRIRYEKTHEPGKLVSVRSYRAQHHQYQVLLDETSNSFKIIALPSKFVVAEGGGHSPANTRIKAKRALTNLGVTFEEEKRKA